MSPRALLPFWLLLGGCAAAAPGAAGTGAETVGETSSAIVNGTPSTTDQDAAVLITIGTGGQFCSGALIAPNLVLTARHCVQVTEETTECGSYTTRIAPETIVISLGADATSGAVVARGKKTFVDSGTTMCSHDIGLILLDKEIPNATIAAVRLDKVKAGETTTTVGYGDNGFGTPTATRYQRAALKIDAVGPASHTYTTKDNKEIAFTVHPGEIATGESTCFGDSGGPLFDAQGSIIGMTSRGLDGECFDRPSIFTDTASHADLIGQAATEAGHPLPASAAVHSSDDATAGDPGEDPSAPTTTTKGKGKSGYTLQPQPNAGCALSPSHGRSGSQDGTSPKWLGFSLIAVATLAARRRRSRP